MKTEPKTASLDEIAAFLRDQGRYVTNGGEILIVRDGDTTWHVWDNGGEIGADRPNLYHEARFAPLTSFDEGLSAATVGLRILDIFADREIDFEARYEI